MSILRIALLQMNSNGTDQAANRDKGLEFCRRAKNKGADIALLPEMWNIGYTQPSPPFPMDYRPEDPGKLSRWKALAIAADDAFVMAYRDLARELEMAICVGFLESKDGTPRNSLCLFDRHGALTIHYSKVHTCEFFKMEAACTPGLDWYVSDLDTAHGVVRVGAMICYDREFPESARILMLKGAEIILTPNACPLEDILIDQFRVRAFENAVGMAMTNYAAPQKNGRSIAVNAEGTTIVEAGGEEGIYSAEFDLDALRKRQRGTIHGNAYRRPHRYGMLTSAVVSEAFARKDATGATFERSKR